MLAKSNIKTVGITSSCFYTFVYTYPGSIQCLGTCRDKKVIKIVFLFIRLKVVAPQQDIDGCHRQELRKTIMLILFSCQ
jgi:hypothetical protein